MNLTIATIYAAPEPLRGRLTCPVCRDAKVIPTAVDCISLAGLRGSLAVDQDGVRLNPTAPAAEGGSAIGLSFRCSHGHVFVLRLRTIYGSTTADTMILPFTLAAQDPELH